MNINIHFFSFLPANGGIMKKFKFFASVGFLVFIFAAFAQSMIPRHSGTLSEKEIAEYQTLYKAVGLDAPIAVKQSLAQDLNSHDDPGRVIVAGKWKK